MLSPASSAKVRMTDRRSAPVKSKLTGKPEYLLLAPRLRHHLPHGRGGGLDGTRRSGRRRPHLGPRCLGSSGLGRRGLGLRRLSLGLFRLRCFRLRFRRLDRRRRLSAALGRCSGLGRGCRRRDWHGWRGWHGGRRRSAGLTNQQHDRVALGLDRVRGLLVQVEDHARDERLLGEGGDADLPDWSAALDREHRRHAGPDIREVDHQARGRILDGRHRTGHQAAVAGQRDPHAACFGRGSNARQRRGNLRGGGGRGRLGGLLDARNRCRLGRR